MREGRSPATRTRFAFTGDGCFAGDGGAELERLFWIHRWRPLAGCDGRYSARGRQLTTLSLAALCSEWRVAASSAVFRCSEAGLRDAADCVRLKGGGGLITYSKADGAHVHTLNTDSGLARKLLAICPAETVAHFVCTLPLEAALLFSCLSSLLEQIPEAERTRQAPALAVALRYGLARAASQVAGPALSRCGEPLEPLGGRSSSTPEPSA